MLCYFVVVSLLITYICCLGYNPCYQRMSLILLLCKRICVHIYEGCVLLPLPVCSSDWYHSLSMEADVLTRNSNILLSSHKINASIDHMARASIRPR